MTSSNEKWRFSYPRRWAWHGDAFLLFLCATTFSKLFLLHHSHAFYVFLLCMLPLRPHTHTHPNVWLVLAPCASSPPGPAPHLSTHTHLHGVSVIVSHMPGQHYPSPFSSPSDFLTVLFGLLILPLLALPCSPSSSPLDLLSIYVFASTLDCPLAQSQLCASETRTDRDGTRGRDGDGTGRDGTGTGRGTRTPFTRGTAD